MELWRPGKQALDMDIVLIYVGVFIVTNIILVVAIIVFFIGVYHLVTKNRKKLKRFRKEWDTGTFVSQDIDYNSVSSYWSNKRNYYKHYDGIDQLTWDDLGMDEVFSKINYTQSTVGSEYLFNQLRDIEPSRVGQQKNEELYQLLSKEQGIREEILLILSSLGKLNYTNSSSYFLESKENQIKYASIYVILALMPILSVLLMFINLKYGIISLLCSFTLNGIIYYRNKNKLESNLYSVGYAAAIISGGSRIASLKHSILFNHLDGLKENVRPIKKVITFNKLASFGSGGTGELDLLFEYIRILFLLDFISFNSISKTIASHRKEFREVWMLIGKLDAAIAIGYYRKSLDIYCTPNFVDEDGLFFENMIHPLIEKPVSNTSSLGKSTLITGSNASGKSTYMKAVAINAILAQTVNTAVAKSWRMKPSYVVTSMAVQDNVLNGDSYFIAEIKSLKRIIRLIEDGKPCLSFIDEILKGTNTIERIAASAAIMEWLSVNNGINILASHDIELTEIVEKTYDNYHFRETVENDEVRFDYKIHSGPSKSRNAIKLLEILTYPQSITDKANSLAQQFAEQRKWGILEEGNIITDEKFRVNSK